MEYTAGGEDDNATMLGTGWVLYVTDGGSKLAADPLDVSIEVRDGDGTDDVDEVDDEGPTTPTPDEFMIVPNNHN